jgi:hypothetical protein
MKTTRAIQIAETLELLANTPSELELLIKDLSASQLKARRTPDEFSIAENLCHLRDIEIEGYQVRIKRILTEDRPALADVDGGRLAVERDYNSQPATEALTEFRRARFENLQALQGIDESQLRREGTLEGVGAVSLEKLILLMHEHDEDHLSDLRILRRWLD